jgi:type IV pilus assembly protein PilA
MQSAYRTRFVTPRKGFSLIELLVVVLILSILMSVALPLYMSAVADSQKKTCRATMQTIANAVAAAWMNTNMFIIFGKPTPATLPDLKGEPICPTSNTNSYNVVKVNNSEDGTFDGLFYVSCSNGHGTFEPGVDSN